MAFNTNTPAGLAAYIAQIEARLAAGGYPSAHAYHWDKDELRRMYAKRRGTTANKLDPVGYWYGGQS